MRAAPLALLLSLGALPAAAQAGDTLARPPAADTLGAPAADTGTGARAEAEAGDTTPEPSGARWRTSWFPYIAGGANDTPVFGFRVRHRQPAEYEARTTYTAAFNGDAGISTRGSRFLSLQFKAPGLWRDWRLSTQAVVERQSRLGFFGLGNETTYDKDLVGDATPYLYRMRRTRYRANVEVTRRIRGPFHAALLGEVEHARFTSLPGPSMFVAEFPAGELKQDDVAGRLALIYDTRDNEYNTHQGLLLEAGTQVGSGADGYTRQYVVLRGYLTVREGTVLAARIAGSGMGGTPTLDSRFNIPAWDTPIPVLGGQYSNRGLDYGRLTGKGTLFGNFEVRHDLLPFGDLGAITLLAFLDAGRVFEDQSFELTTKDMKVGAGGGVALRILRSTIVTFNFAGGPDGFKFTIGNGWMF